MTYDSLSSLKISNLDAFALILYLLIHKSVDKEHFICFNVFLEYEGNTRISLFRI